MKKDAKIRLFVEQALGQGQSVPLSREAAHYLFGVMRLKEGAKVKLFNGKDGEWQADVVEAGKRGGVLTCLEQSAPQQSPPDLWLMFAPIKKARTDFIVEKAAEMGAARICPMQSDFTNSERIRQDRLQAHAIEAAEQCGGTYVPPVDGLMPLAKRLDTWPEDRLLLFCDESLSGRASDPGVLATLKDQPWAILIGPEGGFSDAERKRLAGMENAVPVSLGPRILRADTAAVAAMTFWQLHLGDWR
ncbi:MAG: 16S rRNA (uracil(1498)-N(3))-methyltransferase [Silicimonas sp.]|nr:16S rRNA (uracil(1498)-N(3))-methyltransferase [Silicimonas sp.]